MAAKSERLLNLTIALLSTKRALTKDEIRRTVAGYEDQTVTAFERMFERDKDELRALGVPVETYNLDAYFDDEKGYRIPPEAALLPPVEFTADEAAVLGVAARAWRESSMASATASALSKLRGVGVEPDTTRLAGLDPVVTAREPAFGTVAQAVRERTRIRFGYRDQTRTLEPWALTSSRGRWYVLGRDVDRDAPRMFRLSRMTGVPATASRAGAYDIPDDVDVRALTRSLEPPETTNTALVAVRAGRAPVLRRRGRPVGSADDVAGAGVAAGAGGGDNAEVRAGRGAAAGTDGAAAGTDGAAADPAERVAPSSAAAPTGSGAKAVSDVVADLDIPEGFDVLEVGYYAEDFLIGELAGYGPDVIALAPDSVRAGLVKHLREVLSTHGSPR